MDIIRKEDFDKTKDLPPLKPHFSLSNMEDLSPEEFSKKVQAMNNPLEAQKEMAARVKTFIDFQTEKEMKELNALSDYTRRWIKTYTDLLDAIHKNKYGEKKAILHLHKVSHSDIASKIREYNS